LNVKLKNEDNQDSYQERLRKLQQYCSPSKSTDEEAEDFRILWLEIPFEKSDSRWLTFLSYTSRAYESRSLNRDDLSLLRQPADPLFYNYIKLFEGEEVSQAPLLQIRSDAEGKLGEILFIKGSESIKGSEVKKLAMALINFLHIEIVILHDTAKLEVDGKEIFLKKFLPIVSEDGCTWYERDGFKVFPIKAKVVEKQDCDEGRAVNQSPQSYAAAIALLRTFSVIMLQSFFDSSDERRTTLGRLIKTYLPEEYRQSTLHDLGKAIYLSKNLQDLETFTTCFLTPWNKNERQPSEEVKFIDALEILDSHLLFLKTGFCPKTPDCVHNLA
jgi:hypothetical protein